MSRQSTPVLVADVVAAIRMYEIWGYFSLDDMVARYKRTTFGPLWNASYTIATAVAFAFVFGVILGQAPEKILPRVLTGFVGWQLGGGALIDSAGLLIASAHSIRSVPLPMFWYVCRHLARAVLFFLHNVVVLLPILLYLGFGLSIVPHLMIVPCVLLVMFAVAPWSMALAMICARFRDIQFFVANFSQIIFFATPIMWSDEILPVGKRQIVDYNPFFYLLKVVQDPFLDRVPSLEILLSVVVIGLVGWILMVPVFQLLRNKIPFWL